ncbi:MAG TPA: hypothetical protein VIL55_14185 [Naasia sp.]
MTPLLAAAIVLWLAAALAAIRVLSLQLELRRGTRSARSFVVRQRDGWTIAALIWIVLAATLGMLEALL